METRVAQDPQAHVCGCGNQRHRPDARYCQECGARLTGELHDDEADRLGDETSRAIRFYRHVEALRTACADPCDPEQWDGLCDAVDALAEVYGVDAEQAKIALRRRISCEGLTTDDFSDADRALLVQVAAECSETADVLLEKILEGKQIRDMIGAKDHNDASARLAALKLRARPVQNRRAWRTAPRSPMRRAGTRARAPRRRALRLAARVAAGPGDADPEGDPPAQAPSPLSECASAREDGAR